MKSKKASKFFLHEWLLQGATWLYEAIVGPAFKFVLREASKVPAIQKLIQQTDAVSFHSWTSILVVIISAGSLVQQH